VSAPPAADAGGRVVRVSGPLVEVEGLRDVAMSGLVGLGTQRLPGEVVAISHASVSVQAYEYTGGLAAGDPAVDLGHPLAARLGPDLLGGVFDGLLRPLSTAATWLSPTVDSTDSGSAWTWVPSMSAGITVGEGTVLGTIAEVAGLEYRVLAPPGCQGDLEWIATPGQYASDDVVARIGGVPVPIACDWPVRTARPVRERIDAAEPFSTGQRVLDMVFPVARGSSAAVPGGFGTGKTMLLQQVAKWCSADVIVYVGCGERGNEMADVLAELARLSDPRTGRRLVERTVIIANTSNMPMMARESSVYAAVTVAEHFRDMGYHAVVIADSTSRWAEALREFASRSGALPAEEGYPASLASSLAAFYERAGRAVTLGGAEGSVTIIGAVSPPGGDVSEPVTTNTQRFVRAVWNLDRDLAYARHYPAVGWNGSFSRDADTLSVWFARHGDPEWAQRRTRLMSLLAESDRLGDLADLVGAGSLPGHERIGLLAGRLLREGVLQQNALSANDSHCTPAKTAALVDAVLAVIDECQTLVGGGVLAEDLEQFDFTALLRAAQDTPSEATDAVTARRESTVTALRALR
jgi:V/A-type H+-transporting ATPase subunit A